MSLDGYTCPVCEKHFETFKVYRAHKRTCGLKRLDEFDDRKGVDSLTGLSKRLTALRQNDYDKNTDKTDSVQVNLKNRPVKR